MVLMMLVEDCVARWPIRMNLQMMDRMVHYLLLNVSQVIVEYFVKLALLDTTNTITLSANAYLAKISLNFLITIILLKQHLFANINAMISLKELEKTLTAWIQSVLNIREWVVHYLSLGCYWLSSSLVLQCSVYSPTDHRS